MSDVSLLGSYGGAVDSASLPAATSTTAGAVVGLKQYVGGTDFTVSSSISGFSLSDAYAIPYQTVNGIWRLKFWVSASFTSSSGVKIAKIEGISISNLEPIYVLPSGGSSVMIRAFSYPESSVSNKSTIQLDLGSFSDSVFRVSGDIQLNSKPTWAD